MLAKEKRKTNHSTLALCERAPEHMEKKRFEDVDKANTACSPLYRLPAELLEAVGNNLPPASILSLRATSHRFVDLCSSNADLCERCLFREYLVRDLSTKGDDALVSAATTEALALGLFSRLAALFIPRRRDTSARA